MNLIKAIEWQMRRPTSEQNIVFKIAATPLAILWKVVAEVRNWLFDVGFFQARHLAGRVWSVGNLVVGGTGKSPLTVLLASGLQARGFRPAILTRGYGIRIRVNAAVWLENGTIVSSLMSQPDKPTELPDEARMLSWQLPGVPVICSPNRFEAARWCAGQLGEGAPTHWLLDDGFQHRSIYRNVDVLVMDKSSPYGNGWCVPRGILREPSCREQRAQVIVWAGNGENVGSDQHRPSFDMRLKSCQLLEPHVKEAWRPVAANIRDLALVTAIARPERVIMTLKEYFPITLRKTVIRPDHHRLTRQELVQALGSSDVVVVTTAKDYWRHPEVWHSLPNQVVVLCAEWAVNDMIWDELLRF